MDGQDGEAGAAETKRDRVRRLLLTPLGFRFRREVGPEDQRRFLDGLADELGYMGDRSLAAMAEMLRGRGQGSERNHWPDRATFVGLAEVVEPRPLDELPALLRWFGSVEGPRAIAEGTLVETWEYLERRKVPPVTVQARALVAEAAAEAARRLVILAERRAQGLGVAPEEAEWERWYLGRRAAIEAIVARQRAGGDHRDGQADGSGVAA